MLKHFFGFFLVVMAFPMLLSAQVNDSIVKISNDVLQHDTVRIQSLWKLAVTPGLSEAEVFHFLALSDSIAQLQSDHTWKADNLRQYASYYYWRGQLMEATIKIKAAIAVCQAYKDKDLEAHMLGNLGILYRKMGNYVAATDAFRTAEKIHFANKDSSILADTYNNLGNLLTDRHEYDEAKNYYEKSLAIRFALKDTVKISSNYLNMGNLMEAKKDYPNALLYYRKSGTIGNKFSFSILNNIGSLFITLNQLDSAKFYLDSAFAVAKNQNNESRLTLARNNLAHLAIKNKNYNEAIALATAAFEAASKNDEPIQAEDASYHLEVANRELGNFEAAYQWNLSKLTYRDSVWNKDNIQEAAKRDAQHEYEKYMLSDSIVRAKNKEIDVAKIASINAQNYALWGGLGAAVILGLFVYRGYRRKKADNILILESKEKVELQKQLVEEKNKEIVDSITYAKRLQDAILPSPKLVQQHLPKSFILFLPKDIVAGDFYWMEVIHNTVYVAAADCTGHGVPGAMVSVVCSNVLNKVVLEMKLTDPGEILDKSRELVAKHFGKGQGAVKDGMDISFARFNKATNTLAWAGAYNPLWLIRNSEILEYKANKQPVGQVDAPLPFTTHHIQLQENDTLYLFSDGYADQFGGIKGKKLKTTNLKKILLEIQSQDMPNQQLSLETAFQKWRGNLEQLDDVCLIGIRV